MAATVVQIALANVLLAIFVLIMAPFGIAFAFFMYKDIQPVKARSKILITAQYIGCVCLFASQRYAVTDDGTCTRGEKTLTVLTELLIVSLLLRCIRLLLIFSITKYRLKNKENANRSLDFYISERFMTILFVVFAFIFCGATALSDILDTKDKYDCNNIYSEVSGIVVILILLVGFVVLAFKLRKAHDAFFIKNEFKLQLANTVLLGVPAFVLLSFQSTKYWGNIVLELNAVSSAIISFVVPCVKSYWVYEESHKSSSFSSEMLSSKGTMQEDMPEISPQRDTEYMKHPHILKIVQSPTSEKFVKAYILHYQDLISTDLLNFHIQATEFRALAPEFRTGKGYLLFQKFVSPNAYRYIACIDDEHRKMVETAINEAMEENSSVSEKLFDEMLQTIEKELISKLYKPFMKSEYFGKWKEAMLLNDRLE